MADLDVVYLKQHRIPALLETIAADICAERPADPQQFLRDRFAAKGGSSHLVSVAGEELRVLGHAHDPSTAAVLFAVAYAGAKAQYTAVPPGDSLDATQRSLTPLGQLPVLQHGGVVVVSEGAILRYLCSGKSAHPLGAKERARVESALECIRDSVGRPVGDAVQEAVGKPAVSGRPVDEVALASAGDKAQAAVTLVGSTFFKTSAWAVGGEPTIADFELAACAVTLSAVVGVDCCTEGPLKTWMGAVRAAPWFDGVRSFAASAMRARRAK